MRIFDPPPGCPPLSALGPPRFQEGPADPGPTGGPVSPAELEVGEVAYLVLAEGPPWRMRRAAADHPGHDLATGLGMVVVEPDVSPDTLSWAKENGLPTGIALPADQQCMRRP